MQVDIRPMTDHDRPTVTALLGEVAREPDEVAGRMLGFLDKVALVQLVAEVDGVVVGRSNVARTPMMQADTVALNVSVTSSARRRGVGAALFDRTTEHVPAGTRRVLAFTNDRDDDITLEGARTFGTEGLLVLVREAGRPVAMSLAQHTERDRWTVLYTGVRPDDRGRALGRYAKVLLHDALAARGVRQLHTDNEATNAGIRHVNEQLGYRRTKGSRRHQRDLTLHPLV